ncbi:carbon-nitrogen hydrolase family protein [Brevundimonas sp.]|uniref:carbon-nitrogen hydrolase family protein n=1 Tax=Brevundimonas sp. TaxID=1871086 RepID=UPI0025C19FA5|nr:carbon-nitrogen hydrolase family protein [Brevundimonas sp.]
MSTLSVALIQTRTPASPGAAFAHVEPLIRQAAAGGARLILTPEATNFLIQDRAAREAVLVPDDRDEVVAKLKALAKELGVWLLIGSAIVRSGHEGDDRAANRSILIDDTGVVTATYDKMHVYDVDLPTGERWRESASVRPGETAVVAPTPWGGLGLTICYDVRFPQLHRALAKAGAKMIAVPAAFTVPTGEAHWEVLLRARAIETGTYILAPAQAGTHEDGRRTWGRSTVVAPWGEVIAKLDTDEPGVLFATLDFDAVDKARNAVPQLTHDRDFAPPAPLSA